MEHPGAVVICLASSARGGSTGVGCEAAKVFGVADDIKQQVDLRSLCLHPEP